MANQDKVFEWKIKQHFATLSENEKGYTKQFNLIAWNKKPPKYDIREFPPDEKRCGKGITLNQDEAYKLYQALKTIFEQEESKREIPKDLEF